MSTKNCTDFVLCWWERAPKQYRYMLFLFILAGELGEDIRKLILKIYSAFLSSDGRVRFNFRHGHIYIQ